MRAPLILRQSGSVCSPSSGGEGFASPWVSIESQINPGISQIGWDHDAVLGFCRFWEWNDGHGFDTFPVQSGCGTYANATTRLFKVQKVLVQAENTTFYSIFDCGATDWGTCTTVSGGPRSGDLGASEGALASETNFPGCTNEMMGSASYRTVWGGTDPIMGQKAIGGGWTLRVMEYLDLSTCSAHISPTHTNDTFRIYDSRN